MLNKRISSRGLTAILTICILTCLWFIGKSYLWRSQPTEPDEIDKPPISLSPSTMENKGSITSKKVPSEPPKRFNIKLPRQDEPEPPVIPQDKADRLDEIRSTVQEQGLRGELTPLEADELLTKKTVEILTEGMDALRAAKYLKSLIYYSEYVEKFARQAVDEDPNSFEALLLWAGYQERDSTESEMAYRKLVDMDPTSVDAWVGLGHSLWYNHPEEAIEHLHKANSLDPNAGLYILGDAYQRLGEYDKALETYKKAFEIEPIPPTFGDIRTLEAGKYSIYPINREEPSLGTETEDMPIQDGVAPLPPAEEPVTSETQVTLKNDHQETAPIQETVPLTQQEIDDFLQQLNASGQSFDELLKALDKSDSLVPTEKRIETFLQERFSPERLNRASETLNRYGPEEGLRRLQKEDPEIAKQIGRLINRRPSQPENDTQSQ